MQDLKEVAYCIVVVALGISSHRVAVVGVRQVDTRRVGRTGWLWSGAYLAEMLAAGRFFQTVDRVVDIVVARLDPLVTKEHDVLNVGVVLDMSYVANRVVGVRQVLHDALAGREPPSSRREASQSEGLSVVFVLGLDVVAVLDQDPLPPAVVPDVYHD